MPKRIKDNAVSDSAALHCVNDACRRAWPRAVAFCPYCGTRQQALAAPAPAAAAPAPAPVAPPAPPPFKPPPAVPPVAPPARPHAVYDEATLRIPELDPHLAYRPSPPRRKPIGLVTWLIVLMALTAIWLLARSRPNAEALAKDKAQARVEAMLALVADCRLDEAKAALAALKSNKTPPALLVRAQNALREARPGCDKKQAKAKEWADTDAAVDALLDAKAAEKAAARLAPYVQKWGENDATRELRERIAGARVANLLDQADACMAARDGACAEKRIGAAEAFKRSEFAQRIADLRAALSPLLEATLLGGQGAAASAPALPPALQSQPPRSWITSTEPAPAPTPREQATRILAAARRDIVQANYKVALDRLDSCVNLVDPGNRECLALQQTTRQLQADMQQCLRRHADWVDGRCQ
jgi:hypothetical protein